MKKSEAAKLVAVLSAVYPRSQMNLETMRVYETMMEDLDFEVAQRAITKIIATSKWLPAVSEIRSAYADLRVGQVRAGGEAWGDVQMAVRLFGRYATPKFTDHVVAECVTQMGWRSICDSTNDIADRARFIELYNELAMRDRTNQVASPNLLIGGPVAALPKGRVG